LAILPFIIETVSSDITFTSDWEDSGGIDIYDAGAWDTVTSSGTGLLSVSTQAYEGDYALKSSPVGAYAYNVIGKTFAAPDTIYLKASVMFTRLPKREASIGFTYIRNIDWSQAMLDVDLHRGAAGLEWTVSYYSNTEPENLMQRPASGISAYTWYTIESAVHVGERTGWAKTWISVAGEFYSEAAPTHSAYGIHNNMGKIQVIGVGGYTALSALDVDVFIDSVVVSSSFIGPDASQPTPTDTPQPTPTVPPVPAGWTWQDDFNIQNPRWTWNYEEGTGYNFAPSFLDGYNCAELGISSESTRFVYSDSAIATTTPISAGNNYTIQSRFKFSDDGITASVGSRGFGWWNDSPQNCFWFWCQNAPVYPEMQAWRMQVVVNGEFILNYPFVCDPLNWHTYRIEVYNSGVIFSIDDTVLVSITNASSSDFAMSGSLVLWTDNGTWNLESNTPYQDCAIDEIMYVDYVYYYQGLSNPQPTPTPTATPIPTPTPTATPTPTPTPRPPWWWWRWW
jgi:hypothetical protein